MDATTFRTNFPEFADVVRYADAQVNFQLGLAAKCLSVERWDTLLDHGLSLFTAHHLVLARACLDAAAVNGTLGESGLVSQESVGEVSMSFDTKSASLENAGHWNQTHYGRQYLQLARMLGVGCIQL